MTKNGLSIQTISTKWADIQTAHILLLRQVTKKKQKSDPLHFIKFHLSNPHHTYLVLPDTKADPSENQKSAIFVNAQRTLS